jgi:hypothetical protein
MAVSRVFSSDPRNAPTTRRELHANKFDPISAQHSSVHHRGDVVAGRLPRTTAPLGGRGRLRFRSEGGNERNIPACEGEQIARRREELAAGLSVTKDDVRRAAERNEEAYDNAAAAHDRAASAQDDAARRDDTDTVFHEAAAARHRTGRDADERAGDAREPEGQNPSIPAPHHPDHADAE